MPVGLSESLISPSRKFCLLGSAPAALAALLFVFGLAGGSSYPPKFGHSFPKKNATNILATGQQASNPAYRVQVYSRAAPKLPATQNWTLQYQFTVPPLPASPTWDFNVGTVYQWGDVDFDAYGSGGTYKLSRYKFNQIVPQLILGSVLDGNDANYKPSWSHRSTWAIQAQYYWYDGTTSTSYAQTGKAVDVSPGDQITTTISFDKASGSILGKIADDNIPGATGISSITISRPFPNDSLFPSWTDFFSKAAVASKTDYVLSTPAVDVETDYVDQQTMCGLLPLTLNKILVPGIPSAPSAFSVQQLGGFTCPIPSSPSISDLSPPPYLFQSYRESPRVQIHTLFCCPVIPRVAG